MVKSKFIFPFFLFIFLTNACKRPSKLDNIVEDFDIDELRIKIEHELKSIPEQFKFKDTLIDFYSQNEFYPMWLEKINDSLFRDTLNKIAEDLVYDGLLKKHYHFQEAIKLIDSFQSKKTPYETLAKIEIAISSSIIQLWHDKVLGRTNPQLIFGNKYTLPYPNHPVFNLMSVLDTFNGLNTLLNYMPNDYNYINLKNLIKTQFANISGVETLINPNGIVKISLGDSSPIIPSLFKRLKELEFLSDTLQQGNDSLNYTQTIKNAVVEFQKHINISDDGVIGLTTIKALNFSRNEKLDEIRANLERIRWIGQKPIPPYIEINLPEFMLYMQDTAELNGMKICIGKGKEKNYEQKKMAFELSGLFTDKPLNHETPQIYSNVEWVILNPTWTVPSSIVGREMYNQIIRDPGYLVRNNYQVYSNEKLIDPYSINWRKYKPGNIPFKIRQSAGDDNALGKIKFTFKNDFSIFMHDTPLKSKFNQNNRAVSHGCVRLEKPTELAEFILKYNKKNTSDDFLIMMGQSPKDSLRAKEWEKDSLKNNKIIKKTYSIRVESKPIVWFNYRTIIFENGKARYLFDLYDKNRLIINEMNK
jgi:murein L,D-transpeptidase YcbB/YkuD